MTCTTWIAGTPASSKNSRPWGLQSLVPARSLLAVGLLAASVVPTPPPPEAVLATEIVISTEPGQLVALGDYLFAGPLVIRDGPDGLAVTETVDPETYLLGIREVPFSWPAEALRTQAVAARTYLAFTLSQGRTTSGRAYAYDICATTACQVYAGRRGLESAEGARWRMAVEATAGEILLHEGRPIQALYSSTAGGRTRESEDIFPGLDAPYLSAVDSPGEESPFVDWSFVLSETEMETLLAAEELLAGPLHSIGVVTTPDGGGPWQVVIRSGVRTATFGTYQFRSELNRAAAALPEELPAERPDGRRYPQAVMSGTYQIMERSVTTEHNGYRVLGREFVFTGNGWGHQVGMSQFGAKAMADRGALYSDILAHYYGGLRPQPAAGWLPEQVTVGLQVGVDELSIVAPSGAKVAADGAELAAGVAVWRFSSEDGRVATSIPQGIGEAPDVRSRLPYRRDGFHLAFHLTAPAEVTMSATVDGIGLKAVELGLVAAGFYDYLLTDLFGQLPEGVLRVDVCATSPLGADVSRIVRIPERR